MNLNFFTLDKLNSYPLVNGAVIRPLKVNADERGTLTEVLKTTWKDVFNSKTRPFYQMYFSQTQPNVARDEDRWHYHPGGQEDRFGVISGDIVVAIFDNNPASSSYQQLNLFLMGESQGEQGQYLLMVPKKALHGFLVVSKKPAVLFNFPTRLYDPKQEVRVPFSEVKMKDGLFFNWDLVRKNFK